MSDVRAYRIDEGNLPFASRNQPFVQFGGRYYTILADYDTGNNLMAYASDDGAAGWTEKDAGNAPTTYAVPGYLVDGSRILVAVTDTGDHELKLYEFEMGTEEWAHISDSGITAGPTGADLLIAKTMDGKYAIVYYPNSANANYVRYDPMADSWDSPVSVGHRVDQLQIDRSDIYHTIFYELSFVAPVNLRHQAFVNDVAQTNQIIWTGPATSLPVTVVISFPVIEWNGKIVFGFQRWGTTATSSIRPAIAYANSGEAAPTWTEGVVGGGSPTTKIPVASPFCLAVIGTKLYAIWIRTSEATINNIYMRGLSTAFAWDAADELFYDYTANPPDPNSEEIFEGRLANGHLVLPVAGNNEHGVAAIVDFTVEPGDNEDLTAYFVGIVPAAADEGCLYAAY